MHTIVDKISIGVKPKHETNHEVQGAQYVFSYHIAITNNSEDAIQLMRRQWYISDGVFGEREVEGKGVIGQVPVIQPGETFQYESWCPIESEYGSMNGFFSFVRLQDNYPFDVDIPSFVLFPQFLLN